MAKPKVHVIPAKERRIEQFLEDKKNRKRVAAYARVSTDDAEQLNSYEAQVSFYTEHIQSNPEWQFVKVYTDEGISGLMTKNREGFQEMITEALAGKIDLIITKSVSRFARNTVDTLTYVRKLKEKGVEVYFEKENIYTMDSKGELLITIMSSLAQEESRSLSENVKWGQRKRFADGKVSLAYKSFLGYRKGVDGRPEVVPEEAIIIKQIYRDYLLGMTYKGIASKLMENNIPSPRGKSVWHDSTIKSILTNEKYKGDALLQKKFTVDFLTKKMKVNEGEVPQYYVTNSHEGIVTDEVFEMVQIEMERRKKFNMGRSSNYFFSGRIICGCCGEPYTRNVWHSNSKYKRYVWRCGKKYDGSEPCTSTHLYEDEIKNAFVQLVNELFMERDDLILTCKKLVGEVLGTDRLEKKLQEIQEQADDLYEKLNEHIRQRGRVLEESDEQRQQFEEDLKTYESLQEKIRKITDSINDKNRRRFDVEQFISNISQINSRVLEFDQGLWISLIEVATVPPDGEKKINLRLRNGEERIIDLAK